LFNQDDVIALQAEKGIHRLIPGITPVKWSLGISLGTALRHLRQAGWAQVNGRNANSACGFDFEMVM